MPTSAATTRDATRVLFTPFDLAGLRLKNRLIMAPMGTCLDEGGHITDATIAYYRRRAEGGVGTITVEGVLVSADTEGPEPKISGPEYLPGLKRLVDALREYDVTIGVQLMHPGRQVVARPDGRAVAGAAELARADPARADRAARSRRSSRTTRRPPTWRAKPDSTSSRSTARTATCRRTSCRRSTTAARMPTAAASRTARGSASRWRARSSPRSGPRCRWSGASTATTGCPAG